MIVGTPRYASTRASARFGTANVWSAHRMTAATMAPVPAMVDVCLRRANASLPRHVIAVEQSGAATTGVVRPRTESVSQPPRASVASRFGVARLETARPKTVSVWLSSDLTLGRSRPTPMPWGSSKTGSLCRLELSDRPLPVQWSPLPICPWARHRSSTPRSVHLELVGHRSSRTRHLARAAFPGSSLVPFWAVAGIPSWLSHPSCENS